MGSGGGNVQTVRSEARAARAGSRRDLEKDSNLLITSHMHPQCDRTILLPLILSLAPTMFVFKAGPREENTATREQRRAEAASTSQAAAEPSGPGDEREGDH